MVDDIIALVERIEADVARARERALARTTARHVEPIEAGLGTVTVTGDGELAAVDLDRAALKRSTGSALAAAVLAAVRKAEERANG